jgi:hypothetical protein
MPFKFKDFWRQISQFGMKPFFECNTLRYSRRRTFVNKTIIIRSESSMPTLTRRSKAGNYAFLLSGLLILFFLMPLLSTFPALAKNALLMRITLQVGYSALMLLGIWGLPHGKIFSRSD